MEPAPHPTAPVVERAVACAVLAAGTLRATADMIPALRQSPGPEVGDPYPTSFLKHADEQTVAGLAAVFRAIHHHGLKQMPFVDWGVVAAPRFLGRATLAVALERFALEGAWGVSPHLIPHRSLHSISGTVSQALGIKGPNFGVGGGPLAADEAFLVAGTLLAENRLPGLWVVLTAWEPEPVLEGPTMKSSAGPRPADSDFVAAALALAPLSARWQGARLDIGAGPMRRKGETRSPSRPARPPFSLVDLVQALSGPGPRGAAWRLGCGGEVQFQPGKIAGEDRW